jgi:hypothetical protein
LSLYSPITCTFSSKKSLNPLSGKLSTFIQQALFMDVVVTGIGLVSALGNLENSWKQLLSANCGIRKHQPFLELEPQLLALIDTKPADLITLTRQVLADALQDANLTLPLPDCGIAIGSSRGFQANLELLARERERGRRGELPIAQCPMPDAQCPMPNSQFPIPNSQFSICGFFASYGGDRGGEGNWLDGACAGADGCLCDGPTVDRPRC